MIRNSLGIILLLQAIIIKYIVQSQSEYNEEEDIDPIHRVAFIFAGSPRSFIYPAVHESIRFNLINSFCPPESCIPDVFARVSMADNTHEAQSITGGSYGLQDSKGIKIDPDASELPLVVEALSRLQFARGSRRGSLEVKYMDVGSSAELSEMESSFSSDRHKVFRTLDPRRYSMYFGRWSAYSMARQFETSNNISYSWFVHTRFDMAFGAPVKPCHLWSPAKVWVTDLWPSDVPDTFALLAPPFVERYFSMDKLVVENAMCLGGPNFNMKTLEPDYLVSIGLTPSQSIIANKEKCTDLPEGWSERILLRKLDIHGINRKLDTLGFASFFMVVIRKSFAHFCSYLNPGGLIGWLIWNQYVSGGLFSGCNFMLKDFGTLFLPTGCGTRPSTKQEYEGTCLLNKVNSDWNFLPFRIRTPIKKGGDCVTLDRSSKQLSLKPCVDYQIYPHFPVPPTVNMSYSMEQLFYFHPLDIRLQMIRYVDYSGDGDITQFEYCLSAHSKDLAPSFVKCNQGFFGSTEALFFQVDLKLRTKRLNRHENTDDFFAPILKKREFVSFQHGMNCLSHSNGTLSFEDCSSKKRRGKSTAFIAERAVIT